MYGDIQSLRVGLTAYRTVMPETVASLWPLAREQGVTLEIVAGADIARARNDIAAGLKEDALLFVDSDMSFDPTAVRDLLRVLENQPRRGAVSALYITWTGSKKPVCNWLNGKGWLDEDKARKRVQRLMREKCVAEVDKFGAGLLAIRREVFQKVPYPWFAYADDPDLGPVSEDTYFCRALKKAGFKPSVHFGLHAGHIGPTMWSPKVLGAAEN